MDTIIELVIVYVLIRWAWLAFVLAVCASRGTKLNDY